MKSSRLSILAQKQYISTKFGVSSDILNVFSGHESKIYKTIKSILVKRSFRLTKTLKIYLFRPL
jgi:hypothetical protein